MFFELIILIFLIILSAFFSSSEMAYVTSNKIKVEIKARKKKFSAKNAFYFINNPQDFFSTILIGNNIANIAFASVSVLILTAMGLGELSILLISTCLILIMGDLLPKYFARETADRFIIISAIPVRIIYYVLFVFVKLTSSISSFITKSASAAEENINYLFDRENIESLVKESHEAGMVNKNESDIISKVFALADQKVYEAMRPRTDITGVEINQNIEEVLSIFIDSGYSKLPVYEENLDNIKGVVYAYDLFKYPKNIQDILREMIFVPETKKSYEMLNEFLNKRVSIAAVIDEFGGTAGIVTMEDIIEELFGEIEDEYDVPEDICKKINDNTYIISGKIEVDFINEKYNLDIPTGDYETIAGYITYRLGRIPVQGETVTVDNFTFFIARSSQTNIDIVRLTLNIENI